MSQWVFVPTLLKDFFIVSLLPEESQIKRSLMEKAAVNGASLRTFPILHLDDTRTPALRFKPKLVLIHSMSCHHPVLQNRVFHTQQTQQ